MEKIPEHILVEIFKYLDDESLERASRVNRR